MISIIVSFYNNRREARNTLRSLSRGYQRDADAIEYEVIALDNGSGEPLDESEVRAFGPEFRHRFFATSSKSPAAAVNAAAREAAGDKVMVLIDGAHIVSPGVLRLADDAFRLFPAPFIATPAFHLGPKRQNLSVLDGYDQQVEDELLSRSGWTANGYRLFLCTRAFADGGNAWFGQMFESGCFALRKQDYLALGGLDERFALPGGGLLNLEFFQRAVDKPELEYVMLLGEGSFHQFHGGVSTNTPMEKHPFLTFHEEFERIRGKPLARNLRRPYCMGRIPDEALRMTLASANWGLKERLAGLASQADMMEAAATK